MFCEFEETQRKFLNKKIYKCRYCETELALEDGNVKVMCFKKRIDMQRSLLKQTLRDNPIYIGTDYGSGNEAAKEIGIYERGDLDLVDNEEIKEHKESVNIKPPQHQETKTQLCSKEQIDKRLEICNTCEHYQEDACMLCGCRIVREKNYLNKLANKNASCPANKWGPVN